MAAPDLERRRARGMCFVAASAAVLILSVCGLARPRVAGRDSTARLSLAMVRVRPLPGPPADRESFAFTVPPGLSAGQPFVVNVPGHGSLLESVPTGMHPERRLQLNYAREPSGPEEEEANMLALPEPPSKLPVLAPLAGWPLAPPVARRESLLSRWRNRPSPVQDDDASASELANWHPQHEWAQKHAADTQVERSMIAAEAQPILSRKVSALKGELAVQTGRLHAAAKQESVLRSEAQVWKSRFEIEKKRLVQTWRQGEKELGGREEAEKQALRLRKEVLADQEKVGKLSLELTSRKKDINLLQHQLSSVGTVGGIHALRAENKKLKAQVLADKAQVQADDAEKVYIKHVLALHHAISGTSTDKLKLKNEELSNLDKEMTEMTRRYAIQAAQLKNAKKIAWMLASRGKHSKQATLAMMRDQGVEASQQKAIDALHERLATIEAESKDQGSRAESKIEVQSEKKEIEDLKAKLALVKKAETAKSAQLATEVEALKSQASDVKTALSKVVQFSDHHALKEIEELKESQKKEEGEVSVLKRELDNKAKQLNDAQAKAANEPVLQKELEKVDDSMHKLWEKLSRKEAKLHSFEAKEENREQLVAEINTLKENLEAHRDLEIQSLRKALASKESELNKALVTPNEADKAHVADVLKADKAHVNVVLKDESELRQKLQNETHRITKLLDEDEEIMDDDEAKKKQLQNDDSVIRKLQGELSRVKAKLHAEQYDDESELRQQLQNETQHETTLLDAKERQLEKDDSLIHKLEGELSRVEAKLHAEEEHSRRNSKLLAKVHTLQKEKSELRTQLHSFKHKSVQLLKDQQDTEEAKVEEAAKASTIRQHDVAMGRKLEALRKKYAELKTAEETAEKAKSAAEDEARRARKEVDRALESRKTVSGDEAELRREEKADSQKIGSLEGELEVNTDEESILQQKFTESQAKLLLMQQQGNYSNVHELQAKLKAARDQIQTLVRKLDEKAGELAVKQDEEELESTNSGKGAAMQEELEKEHDKRVVAEAMVAELQKMVTGEQDKLSHIKGKLWKSQMRVGRLDKEIRHE